MSTLNYKDALVVSGRYPGLKTPMVGGCDLVGRVVEDQSGKKTSLFSILSILIGRHRPGDRIIINGWGVGTDHWGGYAGMVRLRSGWALTLPQARIFLRTRH